ncbi:MAG: isoprenylcysteine carboxylmethyltransferase family protein [Candidatus Omnitrophica bacterium]|nr:isoprenylcysteine carboxylmethyltransferase family protein [Candidatus Omnitrophota bacterium]
MKFDKIIPKFTIIVIAMLLSIYSLKFFNTVFRYLTLEFPVYLDHKWWKFPRSPFIYASLFLLFLLTFFIRKTGGKVKFVLLAFFTNLLFEMYGFSFSLYIIYAILGHTKILAPYVKYPNSKIITPHLISFPVLVISLSLGIFLIMKGWTKIYNSNNELVTSGIYKHLRHPQYLGLIVILAGNLFFLPTPFMLCLFIIISIMYYRLAKSEEQELESLFKEKYKEYKNNVPMWIPFYKKKSCRPNI